MTRLLMISVAVSMFLKPYRAEAQLGFGGGPSGQDPAFALGGFGGLEVQRVEARIDLREAPQSRRCWVDYTYAITNPRDSLGVTILLPHEGVAEPIEADLDGSPARLVADARVDRSLAEWRVVDPFPTPPGLERVAYSRAIGQEKDVGFTMLVPPGPHRLHVRERARPQDVEDRSHVVSLFQLELGLAPLRLLPGRHNLAIKVLVPPGWSAASLPALRKNGDSWEGDFPETPADALAFSTGVGLAGAHGAPYKALFLAFFAVLAAGPVFGARIARQGRRLRSGWKALAAVAVFPGLLYLIGDRIGLKMIASRVGVTPHPDGLTRVFDIIVFVASGLFAMGIFLLAAKVAHAAARRRLA